MTTEDKFIYCSAIFTASLCFGLWQESFHAGEFLFFTLIVIVCAILHLGKQNS